MKKFTTEQALPIITQAAKEYNTTLLDKHFLIVYQGTQKIHNSCISFRDYNFLHLTGVKTTLSAQTFYSACISGKLSAKDITVDKNGKVHQKLNVLPYLPQLFFHNCMIGSFINNGILIQADYFVGDTKAILSVGFKQGETADIPVTLYSEDIKKLSSPTYKVLAIFSKPFNNDVYNSCAYLSKNQDISKFPPDVTDKLGTLLIPHK